MSKCIFCSIIEGQIPAYVIYQDDIYLVILDRYPVARGHVLIISKRHVKDIYELNEEETANLMPLAQKIAKKIQANLGVPGLNLIQNNGKVAGQVIDHFHLHLVPRHENDGIIIKGTPQEPTLEELELIAQKLKQN